MGIQRYFPAVHSHFSLDQRRRKRASFHAISTPEKLRKLDGFGTSNVIQRGVPLVGPVPYRGGSITAEFGLFSVVESNILTNYLGFLEKIAEKAGVSAVERAVPYGELIHEGIRLFAMAAGKDALEVGVSGSIEPKAGLFVVVKADAATVMRRGIRFDVNGLRWINDESAITEAYVVLRLSGHPARSDFASLPGIAERYDELIDAIKEGKPKDVDESFAAFRRYVYTCPDLVACHADELVNQVRKEVRRAMGEVDGQSIVLTSGDHNRGLPPLAQYHLSA